MALQDVPRYVLRNATCFIDRVNYVGQASEMQTPSIELEYEMIRNAGMSKEHPCLMGFKVEDAEIKLTAMDPKAIKQLGTGFGVLKQFLFTGHIADDDGVLHRAEYYLTGQVFGVDLATWTAGQKTEFPFKIKPYTGKLEMDAEILFEWNSVDLAVAGEPVFGTRAALFSNG